MSARSFTLLAVFALVSPAYAEPPNVVIGKDRVELDGHGSVSTDALFEVGEVAFKKDSAPLIDAIAKAIVKDGKSNIIVDVHTDDIAPDGDRTGQYLLKLSQARADAMKTALTKKGVPAKRITARGRGNERPIANNNNEAGRRQNRRIELIVEPDIRPPTSDDLATYLKAVKGTGTQLVATLETTQGKLTCTLFADRAPTTVANFVGLATGQKAFLDPKTNKVMKRPFYDGLIFHRVIPGFMIQGGDPLGAGTGGPGYQFGDEISSDLIHKPGTLAMANAGPNTNGSQFFITEVRSAHLDNRHSVFGQCKEIEVITKIANVKREPNDRPTVPVVVRRVTFSKVTEQGPADPYR
jgi:peptidyl-prolyl cis-trans isomerase A (cyclophilin A)